MKINYLSDFKLIEDSTLSDNYTAFRYTFYTSPTTSYEVSFDGEEYSNCRINDDGNLLIIFDEHGLTIGELYVTREYYLSDSDFADGICTLTTTEKTGVTLTTFATTLTTATIQVNPNYQCGLSAYEIAVKNGYTGTEEEWVTSLSSNTPEYPVVSGFNSLEASMQPNIHYIHNSTNLPIMLTLEEPSDEDCVNLYMITIPIVVSSINTISCTSDIQWVGSVSDSGTPIVSVGNIYEVSILNGRGIIVGWPIS